MWRVEKSIVFPANSSWLNPSKFRAHHSATGCSICGILREGIFLEILMISSNFKPKKSPFWPFSIKNCQNFTKLVVLAAKKSSN